MNKLVLAAVVALLASLGVVASGPAAQADPYPGFVPTNCRVKVDHNGKRKAPRILTLVEVPSSRAQPKGLIRVKVRNKSGKLIFDRSFTQSTGTTDKFFAPRWGLSRKYTAKITFKPLTGSVYVGCKRKATFRPDRKR